MWGAGSRTDPRRQIDTSKSGREKSGDTNPISHITLFEMGFVSLDIDGSAPREDVAVSSLKFPALER